MPLSVVVVEDPQAVREGLVLLLEARGCTVPAATGSWRTGLALIERHAPDVSLVDVELADGTGFVLAREALEADPRRRVVLYGRSGDAAARRAVGQAGAQGYALKAGTPDELLEALAVVAGGGTYEDPRLRDVARAAAAAGGRPDASGRAAEDSSSAAHAAAPSGPHPPRALSRREGQILELLARGMTGEDVAQHLVLSAETVRTHVRNAMGKLQASTRVHAVAIALREGYIHGPERLPGP